MPRIVVDTVFVGDLSGDEDDPINWQEVSIPAIFVVCPSCQGEGKSSAYLGSYSSEDLDELGDEWVEDYFAGHFDRACTQCKGNRVILVPDRQNSDPALLEKWDVEEDEKYQDEQMHRMEMEAEYGNLSY